MTHSTTAVDRRVWDAAGGGASVDPWAVLHDAILDTREALAVWTVLLPEMAEFVERLREHGARARRVGDSHVLSISDRRGEFLVMLVSVGGGVWHIASFVPATDPRWNVIRWAGSFSNHRLAPIYLNEEDFLRIGDRLAEFGDLTVSRLTARKLTDGSSLSRGWPQDLGGPSLREAIEEASGCSVRTLLITVSNTMRVHLRRNGGATFQAGDFNVFVEVVLGALAGAGERRFALLAERSREIGQPLRRPLAVRFRGSKLREPFTTASLADAIQRQQPFGVAVLHGNPYIHLVVTDYVDGSNFNVFVAEDDEVRIVPGFRATVPSLARLTDAIGDRLGAETIEEAHSVPAVTLDKLFVPS